MDVLMVEQSSETFGRPSMIGSARSLLALGDATFKRGLRLSILIVAMTSLEGCSSVVFDYGQANPPLPAIRQKPLEASADFFNASVLVSAFLVPVQLETEEERSLAKSARAAEASPPSSQAASEALSPRGPKQRVNLFVSIVNESVSDVSLRGIGIDSGPGKISRRLPGLFLAPGEDALLDTIPFSYGAPVGAVDVDIALREGEKTETRTLHLVPWTGKRGSSSPPPAR